MTCQQLYKRLLENSAIFTAEATAITLALDYYRHMGPVKHDVVFYLDSMSCVQAIEDKDAQNLLICHIMNLLWALSDKGTCPLLGAKPLWHWGQCNKIMDQLAKETLDHDIDPQTTVHYADLKPLVNSYIHQEVQTKWDVSIHGRDLYLVKPALGPPKKFQHLTRTEEVVITRLRIGHTKAIKSHILSRGPTTTCQHCGQTLTMERMLLECTVLQQIRNEYTTVDSLGTISQFNSQYLYCLPTYKLMIHNVRTKITFYWHIHIYTSMTSLYYGSKGSWKSYWIYGPLVWYTLSHLSQQGCRGCKGATVITQC